MMMVDVCKENEDSLNSTLCTIHFRVPIPLPRRLFRKDLVSRLDLVDLLLWPRLVK